MEQADVGRERNPVGEEPATRVVLEASRALSSSDWAVVATCTNGALYVGRCDYGDGDDTTGGFDITPLDEFLSWLVREGFDQDADGLTVYAAERGLTSSPWEEMTDPSGLPDGLSVVATSDAGDTRIAEAGSGLSRACWISTGCLHALSLLADRCQGPDAWEQAERLLVEAGVTAVPRDRGYV